VSGSPVALFGWTKDVEGSDTAKINGEQVGQLDTLLEAQDNLKKNVARMAEKLDVDRGVETSVEQGNFSPAGPDGPRGAKGPTGGAGIRGNNGPPGFQGALPSLPTSHRPTVLRACWCFSWPAAATCIL
jgi:hypothetical protein